MFRSLPLPHWPSCDRHDWNSSDDISVSYSALYQGSNRLDLNLFFPKRSQAHASNANPTAVFGVRSQLQTHTLYYYLQLTQTRELQLPAQTVGACERRRRVVLTLLAGFGLSMDGGPIPYSLFRLSVTPISFPK